MINNSKQTSTSAPEDKKTAKSKPPSRRLAREIALKAAYALELRKESSEVILNDQMITGEGLPPAFTVRLLSHIEGYQEQIDDIIRAKVEKWEFHRIALLDKIILRMGCAEMLYFPDVPPKVSINEAIEIAKTFSTDKSGRFVNGILDAVFSDLTKGRIVLNGDEKKRS